VLEKGNDDGSTALVQPMWWLDIETENSWSENNLSRNWAVIEGVLRYLNEERHFSVGIFSTPTMWEEITGSWQNGLPAWIRGGTKTTAKAHCSSGFTGGLVYLVQYADGNYDGNYAC